MSCRSLLICQILVLLAASDIRAGEVEVASDEEKSVTIFESRILPIFQATKPSSCTECHLHGVELKDYIRSTQQETYSSLVAADMIDTRKPDESKILGFINRRPTTPSLVTEKMRKKEYEAFRDWIRAAVADHALLSKKEKFEPLSSRVPVEVIRQAR
ncbi:hypothetical protein [Thalassoroseus pseudoceratinae]|uniref:hypothetical protein n=1 Tax=Thalassoroseus pseudoceratinae TaxID=2713176 RepID=UPI00141F2658|nr:hypothetical protein [Thalassoroseus pseudoceratinae]